MGAKCSSVNFIKVYNKKYYCVVVLKLLTRYYEIYKGLIS